MCGSGERCHQLRIARLSGKAADLIALATQPLDIGGVAGSAGNAPAFGRKPPRQRLGRETEAEAEQAIHAPILAHSSATAGSASRLRLRFAHRRRPIRRKPRQRPHRHGAHERRGVGKTLLDLRHETLIPGIAGGDQHIAQEPVAPGAFDRRAAEAGAKGRIVERQQLGERRIVAPGPRGELCLARALREFVPRAHGETVVAAEDAVAHGLAELDRDMSLVLDGEVGDAGPRIELIGRDERACRAHVEAASAGAAMILFRLHLERSRRW